MLRLLTDWLSGNKDWIGTVFGILAGPVVTLLKAAIGVLNDRSWDRKSSKNSKRIAQSIRELHEIENPIGGLQSFALEPYRLGLQERIEVALRELQLGRDRAAARARAQLEEPAGIRRWLLLFRPHGFIGWMVHSAFYALLLAILGTWVGFGYITVDNIRMHQADFSDLAIVLTIPLMFCGLAVLPHSIALKRKRLMILLGDRPNPNSDLSWWQRLFLIFKAPRIGISIERFFSYCFFAEFLMSPFVIRGTLRDTRQSGLGADESYFPVFFTIGFFGFLAFFLWYDVLLRRALACNVNLRPFDPDVIGPAEGRAHEPGVLK